MEKGKENFKTAKGAKSKEKKELKINTEQKRSEEMLAK